MVYNIYKSALFAMPALIPPPVLPKRVCPPPPPSRWRIVTTSLGTRKLEEIPLEVVITPSELFTVIELNTHGWNRVRKQERYIPRERAPREIGGVNGKGFGPPRPRH